MKRHNFVLGLFLLLSGLNAAPPLAGQIARIAIVGSVNIPADAIRAHITQKVGAPYRPEAAEKDQAAVQKMGVFREVEVTAVPDPVGGVDLTYTVTEYPIVKSIKFAANTPNKEPTIPTATLLAQMTIKTGEVLNTKVLFRDLAALFNHETGYVAKQGYLFDVGGPLGIDPAAAAVTIPILEKRIQAIHITGNARVKTADILAQMRVKPGALYDAGALRDDIGAIYEMGGFKEVGGGAWTETAPGQVTVTLSVVEREAATLDKLDETQGKIVPFLYDPLTVPLPVVQVSINGQPPLPFIVDTGTTPAIALDPWAAAQLGLTTQAPTEKGNGFNYARVPLQSAVLQGRGHTNDVPVRTSEAFVFDIGFMINAVQGRHVAGIIGMGMFAPLTSRFDFAAKTLTLFRYSHPPLRLPGGTVLPLRPTSDGRYTVHARLAPDAAADLLLDTGSDSTQIPLETVRALHPTSYGSSHTVDQIEGLYLCPDLRLPSLNLGTLRVPDVAVRVVPAARTSLGLDILTGFRVTLDGPNAQLTLEPSATIRRSVQGWSGLGLKQTGTRWLVSDLAPGSPAGLAGVQVGDEIVSINGQSVSGLAPAQLGKLGTGPAGMPFRVSLRRGGGKTLNVSWTPLDEFSAPRDALAGLVLKRVNGGPWVIVNVLKGCPGDKAGLQEGDEITRINEVLVADMSQDQLLKFMGQLPESLTLSVTRAGRAEPLSVNLPR